MYNWVQFGDYETTSTTRKWFWLIPKKQFQNLKSYTVVSMEFNFLIRIISVSLRWSRNLHIVPILYIYYKVNICQTWKGCILYPENENENENNFKIQLSFVSSWLFLLNHILFKRKLYVFIIKSAYFLGCHPLARDLFPVKSLMFVNFFFYSSLSSTTIQMESWLKRKPGIVIWVTSLEAHARSSESWCWLCWVRMRCTFCLSTDSHSAQETKSSTCQRSTKSSRKRFIHVRAYYISIIYKKFKMKEIFSFQFLEWQRQIFIVTHPSKVTCQGWRRRFASKTSNLHFKGVEGHQVPDWI